VALVVVLSFNGAVVSWAVTRLRRLVVSEQAAHRKAAQVLAQLATTSRHKSEFLANTSHELKTPLNAVIGFADLLHSGAAGSLNNKQHDYLTDILWAARHLLAIINDVLDLATLEAGQLEVSLEPLSVEALLERVVSLAHVPEGRRNVSITVTVDPDVDFVLADHHRLVQVLVNLVSNAVKFTPDGGRVELLAAASSDRLLLRVTDTGIGILPEQQERIFEPFLQGTRTLADHIQEGTGLGLSLAKGLIHLHGGQISVQSEPDRGSTFTVSLPRPAAAAQERQQRLVYSRAAGSGPR
jgi:signal transduction histidine kinase